jgi:arylsulfatase A-like enzyme
LGETPNIDRIAKEGGTFTDYYAMQSCTSGRNAFFTGMYPLRTGKRHTASKSSGDISITSTPCSR